MPHTCRTASSEGRRDRPADGIHRGPACCADHVGHGPCPDPATTGPDPFVVCGDLTGMSAYSSLGRNGNGANTVEIRTVDSAASIHGRHTRNHQTNKYAAPESQPLVSALRMTNSLSGMELFVNGIILTFNMAGDTTSGITVQTLTCTNAGIFVCLYPRALYDQEIQQVTNWLTQRWL